MASTSQSAKNVITGDDNVFEISDFTVVTEFEVLILTLENAMQELKSEAEFSDDNVDNPIQGMDGNLCRSASKKFGYKNYAFQIDYFHQRRPMEYDADFCENYGYLCNAALGMIRPEKDFFEESNIGRQYGIFSDFFLLYTTGKSNYMTESTVNMVQSAVNVASLNIECELPVFFQFAHGASVGVLQNRNFFTNFEGAVLNKCLSRQKYLEGIIDMFKQKINSPSGANQKIKVSLQHDFQKNFESADLSQIERSEKSPAKCYCRHKYPFQTVDLALIKNIKLGVVWVDLDEHYLAETDNFSNIDPESAHRWKISINFDDEFSFEQSYLFGRLFELSEEEFSECTVKSQIPVTSDLSSLGTAAFGPLINKPVVRDIDIIGIGGSGSTEDSLSHCINFIMSETTSEEQSLTSVQEQFLNKISFAKATPTNSLTRRLAVCLVCKIDGNFVGFCRLWIKFLEILRHHWEYNQNLPGFAEDERPDLSCCLLHQKLQMIQYCISVKKKKHRELETNKGNRESDEKKATSSIEPSSSKRAIITTEEEFFDANESFEEAEKEKTSVEARGRSHALDECLKNRPTEKIYVPITQDAGPMTEDQIEERESYLVSLEDPNLRTRAQSELLLSDMQAFKAANPGSVIEDFLQWHSPRDITGGELSERMKLPGNLWQETWDSAGAVPAAQQVRLFNETREVEQILQYFGNLRVKEIVELILPIVSVQMSESLIKNATNCLDLLKPMLETLCDEVNLATKTDNMDTYFDVSRSLKLAEEMVMKYSTLSNLLIEQAEKVHLTEELELNLLGAFVSDLCKSHAHKSDELSLECSLFNCEVPDAPYGPIFGVLKSFMVEEEEEEGDEDEQRKEKEWSRVIRKQTILRKVVPHPGSGSRPMPQRMYTSYREGEFIFCGSFASDITFL